MPTFFDLQKFAATGIASPDMSAYDKARALAAFGGGAVQTLTDVPPLSFRANGKPLISLSMLGNTQQTGAPTQDAPITPEECGDRTANLFDFATVTTGYRVQWTTGDLYADDSAVMSDYIAVSTGTYRINRGLYVIGFDASKNYIGAYYNGAFYKDYQSPVSEIIVPENCRFVRILSYSASQSKIDNTVMVNTGSTVKPFEPYGYKISITCGSQTTPIYLGQVPTTRRVKKLVLTGNETGWTKESSDSNRFFQIALPDTGITANGVCTHFVYTTISVSNTDTGFSITGAGTNLRIRPDSVSSVSLSGFKQWIADQYDDGTPVIVWYILSNEQTGIVNEPLAKIGDYADELHSTDAGVTIPTVKGENTLTVDTELQPSEMTITYFEEV